jgi:hypothetical protein
MSVKVVKSFRTLTTELAQFTKICSSKLTVSKSGFTAVKPQKLKFTAVNVSVKPEKSFITMGQVKKTRSIVDSLVLSRIESNVRHPFQSFLFTQIFLRPTLYNFLRS